MEVKALHRLIFHKFALHNQVIPTMVLFNILLAAGLAGEVSHHIQAQGL